MSQVRKNEAKTDVDLYRHLMDDKIYACDWEVKKTTNRSIQRLLDQSSKSQTGQRGEPDLLYVNKNKKLLILVENKFEISKHSSNSEPDPVKYAEDGVVHYLSFFTQASLYQQTKTIQKYFQHWSFVGIAFSGDVKDEYNHLTTNYIINKGVVEKIDNRDVLDESDYLAYFENIDLEEISQNISKSSVEINRMLRTIDSQKRPVLLSALMICLYDKENVQNDFKLNYSGWSIKTILRNVTSTINDILKSEGIDQDKIDVLKNELAFIQTDNDLNNSDILKDILTELDESVIPLFNKNSNYDIIGKFYEEFLRYAGIANVKKGIVLTPNHITKLFADLVDFKINDVVLDTCCGTGAFLIAAMNRLIEEIQSSNVTKKKEKVQRIKVDQLIGFEKSSTMYSLAISNMLFRGDGKSRIFNVDAFSHEAEVALENIKSEGVLPTIGFINPPYGGKDTAGNPTKKEIQFLEKLLNSVSRYGVIIAPLSTYFKDEIIRNRILDAHTLKAVINMPGELFQPNASTHTAIAIFETNSPHNNKEVTFYDLEDDGFVLSKSRGRTDVLNKWISIKKNMLEKLDDVSRFADGITCLKTKISDYDEWIIQAHAQTDYTNISEHSFALSVKKHVIFYLKMQLGLLNKEIDELSLMELLESSVNKQAANEKKIKPLDFATWKLFKFKDVFRFKRGRRLVKLDQEDGEVAYISSTKVNNGIDNYIKPPGYMDQYENSMTINNSGSVGYVFYHGYRFVCSDHCTMFEIKDSNTKLDPYLAIFLRPVIEAFQCKYNFAREISDTRLGRETILLPVDCDGFPDWPMMRQYIESLPYSASI